MPKGRSTMVRAATVLVRAACWMGLLFPATGGRAAEPVPDPGNALWVLDVSNVVQGSPITLHLAIESGRAVRCFGTGFNRAVHTVDTSALQVVGNGLRGTIHVTVHPDDWLPPDGKSVDCTLDLEVLVRNDRAGGTFKGTSAGSRIAGMIVGTVQRPVTKISGGTIRASIERALKADKNGQRVNLVIPLVDGKAGSVQATAGNSRWWNAAVKESSLVITPESVTGELVLNVTSTSSTSEGTYTLTFNGQVIGSQVAGTCRCRLGDEVISEASVFSGSVQ